MILAITQRYEKWEDDKYFERKFCVSQYYKDIFEELNILLFPVASLTQLEKVVDLCDGLVVTGRSIDIDPKYYGEEAIEATKLADYHFEDELDFTLIRAFYEKNKPILGICAGIQSINVCFGGSLKQDILNHSCKEEVKMHSVQIEKESFLEKCYHTDRIQVNSFHHQAINQVAQGFRVTAISEDGIIEAIEKDKIVGVQWHPEQMGDVAFFRKYVELYF